MGILSDFKEFGFNDSANLFATAEEKGEKAATQKKQKKTPEEIEQESLFDKSYTCPVCGNAFTAKTVRTGKIKLEGSDIDLRPKYQQMDPLKYDAIVCHKCGYAAISRYFGTITPPQAKLIQENISADYKDTPEPEGIFDYDYALAIHKLALLNAVVKKARASEKAYICLKMAWLCRGKAESLPESTENYEEIIRQCKANEKELLSNACQGFSAAVESESGDICGMDEITTDYLVASLKALTGDFETAMKLLSGVMVDHNANARIKEKARDLKEEIQKRRKA